MFSEGPCVMGEVLESPEMRFASSFLKTRVLQYFLDSIFLDAISKMKLLNEIYPDNKNQWRHFTFRKEKKFFLSYPIAWFDCRGATHVVCL